jgi:tRNA(Ile)-lysidine synthase
MYMRLKRGTTLAGLRGIQEVRILSNSQGVAGGQHLGACSLVRMATKVGLASEAPLEGVMKDRATGCNQGDTSPTHRFENDCSRMTVEEDDSGRFPLTSTSLSTGSGGNDKAETNSLPSTSDRLLPTVSLYRPFLNVTRNELLTYARENGLSWCEDESNADVKFARNKIRHEFLPNLERECPGAIQQLCKIAGLADKAYAKVIANCSRSFDFAQDDTRGFPLTSASPQDDKWRSRNRVRDDNAIHTIALDKKKLNKILREYADADLSELLRLWLTEKGFRFPIGFFYGPKEPAHVKIPVRAVYRRRSIVKIAHTVWICEFKDALSAAKFVSCEKKEKDYNEST